MSNDIGAQVNERLDQLGDAIKTRRNRVFRVEIEHDGQMLSTRISAPSAREALEAAHKALVVRVYEDK